MIFLISPVSSPPLGIADLPIVLNELFPCRVKWYDLGILLRLDMGRLDSIHFQYVDAGDQLRELFKMWLKTSENPTCEVIVEALKSPVIREFWLAMELQQYILLQQTATSGW